MSRFQSFYLFIYFLFFKSKQFKNRIFFIFKQCSESALEEKCDEPILKHQRQLKMFEAIIPVTKGLEYTTENSAPGTELRFWQQNKLLEAIGNR